MKGFDDAVTHRIELHRAAGLIMPFDARPIAMALNRMNADLIEHRLLALAMVAVPFHNVPRWFTSRTPVIAESN